MFPKIGIIIPTYRRACALIHCIQSIKINLTYSVTIVVINDNSDPEVSTQLKVNHPECLMITSNQDLWWTKSVNLGLKYLKSEGYNAAILLNDDVTVSDGFIDSMINMHIIKQDTIVISKIIDLDGKPWSMGGYVSWPFYGERHYISHQTSGSLKSEISWAPGMGTLIPLSVVEQIGYLNEREMPQYLSDADYGLRATKNGWKFFLNDECYIRNDTSSTGGVDGRQKIGLKELYFMLFNLRSPDYLRARFRFIYKHAPLGLRTISFVIRYTKLFIYFIKRSY